MNLNFLTVIHYIYSTYHTIGNFKNFNIILNLWEFSSNQMIILDENANIHFLFYEPQRTKQLINAESNSIFPCFSK